jgi:glycosyltransferase involved in cell wall biosynthesis
MKPGRHIRVLQVIDSLGMGGAETWLMELLRFWSESKAVQIDFLATSGVPRVFDEEACKLGAQIHYLQYRRLHLPRFAREFRRVLHEGRYDAIHDHQDYASGWHFLMGTGALPDVRVTHIHNPWLHIEANYAISPLRRVTAIAGKCLVSGLATHVCGTSGEILRRYGFEPRPSRWPMVSVVHCGFDVAKFNQRCDCDRLSVLREFGWPEESRIVLFAGRLDRALDIDHPQNHKNSWFALNVVRAAIDKGPAVRLLMAGAGDGQRRQLQACIESWGLKNKLRLIGVREDLPRLMHAADVLFFPSRQEGLGMVAVEAQAAALPILASTAVPRECIVIPELYNALSLKEPIDLWADTLLQVMNKPRRALELCRSALEASAFSIANSAAHLEHIYSGN